MTTPKQVKVTMDSPDPKKHSTRFYGPGEVLGSIYLPTAVVKELGDPKEIEVTIKAVG